MNGSIDRYLEPVRSIDMTERIALKPNEMQRIVTPLQDPGTGDHVVVRIRPTTRGRPLSSMRETFEV